MLEPVSSETHEPVPNGPGPDPRRTRAAPVLLLAALGVALSIAGVGLAIMRRELGPHTSPAGSSAASIAVVDRLGSLSVVDAAGHATVVAGGADIAFGFPAWSPDGTRIAAVTADSGGRTSISIFTTHPGVEQASPGPAVVYRSGVSPPFYLAWAPDGRSISFLATEADELSLRIAPADGSAPLDGSGPGGIIHRGAPLYFDWIGNDRLLLHVGSGPDAFLGEVGLDGNATAPSLGKAGDFRSAVASRDRRYVAFVRAAPDGSDQLVVSARDGSGEHVLPVFGTTAAVFDPTGDRVASIAPDQPGREALVFPIGPLRLTDATTGTTRVLLDGTVVGFFWSPDGRTIAALRLQPAGGGSTAGVEPGVSIVPAVARAPRNPGGPRPVEPALGAAASENPSPAPSASTGPAPAEALEVRIVFVDVATGTVRSQRVVDPAPRFVNELLPYFDQYALSHRLWAPDGSSLLLPLVDAAGATHLVALPPGGGEPVLTIDGEVGFWSP